MDTNERPPAPPPLPEYSNPEAPPMPPGGIAYPVPPPDRDASCVQDPSNEVEGKSQGQSNNELESQSNYKASSRKANRRYTMHSDDVWDEYTRSIKEAMGEGYLLDAGPTLKEESKFLSWDYMQRHKAENRPGKLHADGTFNDFPVCMDFGMHVPCKKEGTDHNFCCTDTNALKNYGLGTSLYFKFLKFAATMFLICSIFSIPAMWVWFKGSGLKEERDFLLESSFMNIFLYLQAGSWGDKQYPCSSNVAEGELATVRCELGTIQRVTFLYGDPYGFCGCPAAQKPDAKSTCPKRYPYGPSLTERGEECCSDRGLGDGQDRTKPNFKAVDISRNRDCYSTSAEYIATGICVGRQECTINVSATRLYSFYPDDDFDDCFELDSTGMCRDYFMRKGNFTGCDDYCIETDWDVWSCQSYSRMSVNMVATCSAESVNVYARDATRKSIVSLLIIADASLMFLCWLLILWLDAVQKTAIGEIETETCSPKDYTLQMTGLPDSDDHEKLDKDIRKHFRDVVLAASKVKEDIDDDDPVVVDVNFAFSNSYKYMLLKHRGTLARRIDHLEARRAIYDRFEEPHESSNCSQYAKRRRAQIELQYKRCINRMDKHYRPKLQKLQESEDKKKAVLAYVTFSSEEVYWRCRHM